MKKHLYFLVFVGILGCSPKVFQKKWTKKIAPESYTVQFETSKGNFEIDVTRSLSPYAADRLYQLVTNRYFDGQLFYRVNPGFVAQFGSSNKAAYDSWNSIPVPDEAVVQGNEKGTLSFARGGPESRTTDLFINLGNNQRLDTIFYNDVRGFPSFGRVVEGMEVVTALYSGYADTTMKDMELMYTDKKAFLQKFPKLDSIYRIGIKR
ncbi:peptidylprolyl isomerase [Maribacter chungangensis]|uniref:peptidylprolyl isomerase n=1 Tax=Maribacter chungangensis TaxID=1069117 RepID=A0ABW3B5P4_9FLAO